MFVIYYFKEKEIFVIKLKTFFQGATAHSESGPSH
jgi:hypothetical protein